MISRANFSLKHMRHGCVRHVPMIVVITIVVIDILVTVTVGAGNSGRLMEMLHGSDGWGKLVSELQQKEEADEQQPAGTRRKRARTPKDGLDPLAKGIRYAPTFCRRHLIWLHGQS